MHRERTSRFRLLLTMMIMALFWTGPAWAQDEEEDEKKEVAIGEGADPSKKLSARPTLKGDESDPAKVKAEQFRSDKKFESLKKIDEQIVRIKKLIKITPKNHKSRPEFLFNLAELYWDKSRFYNSKAFAIQDKAFAAKDKGDEAGYKRQMKSMKRNLKESKKQRLATVELYIEIIKNFPKFKNMDEVYFYLGSNLMEVGKRADALKIYKDLIANYPKSRFVPNVLVAFGDYYFDANEMGEALKAYKRVAAAYKKSAVYGYATYKMAWCEFNLDRKKQALGLFLETLNHSKKNPRLPNSAPLLKQSRKDIVMTYSHVGTPSKAIKFFKKIAGKDGDEWIKMSERLAVYYSDKGKFGDSNSMYAQLIKLNPKSVRVVGYQYEIVRNQSSNNAYSEKTLKQIVQLVRLVGAADKGVFKDRDKPEHKYKQRRKNIEELSRNWALRYHREAQQTKNAELYRKAYYIYKYYIETFPDSPKRYMMTFFYAELLYKGQKWKEAAAAYELALKTEPKGKYTEEIVHSTVLAYDKLIDIKEEKANLKGDDLLDEEGLVQADGTKKKGKKPKKKKKIVAQEIPDLHKKYLNACERYAKYAPKGERIVDVKYSMGYIYAEFGHLDKALKVFKDIAYKHSEHRLAEYAANLHLSSLEELGRYDDLETEVKEYLDKKPVKEEAFIADITEMYSKIRFKKCQIMDEKKDWKNASECFVAFYRAFPDSELLDEALYNAALDFERMREIGKAIKVRFFLLKAMPDSEFAPISLYNIAANYQALAIYSQAAKFFEIFVKNFPKHEKAEDALANASTFRQGLGQHKKAIEAFERYIELFNKQKPGQAAELAFQIAKTHERAKQRKSACEQYERYLKKFAKNGSNDRRMEAHLQVAKCWARRGGRSNKARARKEYERTLKVYNKMPKAARKEMVTGRDAAAEAMFELGEEVFREMAAMKIDSRNNEQLKKKVAEKVKKSEEAKKIFVDVIKFQRPNWSIAALFRIGDGFANFADSLRQSKCPRKLTYDQCEIYRGLLEDEASKIEVGAVSFFEKSLETAKKQNWFNKYTREAEARLARLRPKQYRAPSEIRAQPDHVHNGMEEVAFIKEIKDEDRLQDLEKGEDEDGEADTDSEDAQ